MQALESAFQKIVENAEANCPACRETAFWRQSDPTTIITHASGIFHTCDATIDAAAEFGKAAVDSLQFLNIEGCGDCQDTAQFDARATIKRLLEGEG